MEPLMEVHTRAVTATGAGGFRAHHRRKNRDLKTMTVQVETSLELIEQIPDECIAVSESGIRSHEDLLKLRRAGFDAFLVGEHLMLASDPAAALAELLGTSLGATSVRDDGNSASTGTSTT